MSTTIKLAPPALRGSSAAAVEASASAREQQPRSLPRRDARSSPPAERRLEPDALTAHVQRLYRAAYGLCGSREEAEDLVQDTYEKVLRRPRFLHRDHDLAYLLRVLRNTWISSKRTTRPVAYVGGGDDLDAFQRPEDPVASMVEAGALHDALRDLTQPLREAIVAVDVVGLSYKDAARALKIKEGTVMSRLHRARNQLAAHLLRENRRIRANEEVVEGADSPIRRGRLQIGPA